MSNDGSAVNAGLRPIVLTLPTSPRRSKLQEATSGKLGTQWTGVDENTAGFGDWAGSARLSPLRLLSPLLSTPFWAFRTARLSGLGLAGHRAVSPPRLASRLVRPPVLKDVLCR
jgi:hypothetical protein